MFHYHLRHMVCLTLVFAFAAEAAEHKQQTGSLRLDYGAGTPGDAGPLGHCTATFSSDGKVTIESKGRRGVPGPLDAAVFKTDSLKPEHRDAIFKAADVALKETTVMTHRVNEDGHFLRLERDGPQAARIAHTQLLDFCEAPKGMRKLLVLINGLLPEKERIPLDKCTENKTDKISPSKK